MPFYLNLTCYIKKDTSQEITLGKFVMFWNGKGMGAGTLNIFLRATKKSEGMKGIIKNTSEERRICLIAEGMQYCAICTDGGG